MKKGRIILICIALVILTSIYAAISSAQTESPDASRPRMKEGQMFTVKLMPAGKALEVSVVGREMAKVKASDFGLTATFRFGNRVVTVEPKMKADRFVIEAPTEEVPSGLKLEVKQGKKTENFEFDLQPVQP